MTSLATDLLNPLEQRVRKEITVQYNRATPLLNILNKEAGAGKNVAFDVTFGSQVGTAYVEGADVGAPTKDVEVLATLPWCEYGDHFEITGLAEDAAAGSDTELDNLYVKKTMQSMSRVAIKMEADIASGAGTSGPNIFHGFTNATGPLGLTGTYAGIARGTYAQWASNSLLNGGVPRALTLALMHDIMEDIFTSGNGAIGGISAIVAGPGIWKKYGLLASADRRQTLDAVRMREGVIRGQAIKFDAGWEALDFGGIPMFRSNNLTNDMLFINENHAFMKYLPAAAARKARGEILATLPIAGTRDEQAGINGASGLTASLIELSRNGNKSRFQVVGSYALCVDKPNAHGRIGDLDGSL